MRPDVDRYISFYNTLLGKTVAQIVSDRLDTLCAFKPGDRVGFLGYGVPYSSIAEQHEAEPLLFMPGSQGAHPWKTEDGIRPGCRVAMVDDGHLPLPDCSLDGIILVHALEHNSRPNRFIREVWRVLKPSGHIAIVVPNRSSSWTAFETTPFAYGRPWSRRQLTQFLQDHLFTPKAAQTALMLPPVLVPAMASLMRVIERPMRSINANFGGLLIVMADKEMAGGLTVKVREKVKTAAPEAASSTISPAKIEGYLDEISNKA